MPLYTVGARLHRNGGLPLVWAVRQMAGKAGAALGARGGVAVGAAIGSLLGPIGTAAGGLIGGLAGDLVGGEAGVAAGEAGTAGARCGVDLDIQSPRSEPEFPYSPWMLDIPFEVGGPMPTVTSWDRTLFVQAGSAIDIEADDSLCYQAKLEVELAFEYECELYCTSSDAVCPDSCPRDDPSRSP